MLTRLALAAVPSLALATAASAHHSPAAYDTAAEITIEGTVSRLEWKNPHIYLTLRIEDADGAALEQLVEALPIPGARTMGLKREMLAVGSRVVVRAHPNRGGPGRTVLGVDVTTADGAVHPLGLDARAARAPAAAGADGIAGRWAASPESFLELARAAPATWPLTPAARQAQARPAAALGDAAACGLVPPPMAGAAPVLREIEVGRSTVTIRYDAPGRPLEEIVHLDRAERPAGLEPSFMGYSIGRWEGATLVIDTAGYAPHPAGLGFGAPSGAGKHLIERLTPSRDRSHIEYSFTLEDPDNLSAPASFFAVWDYRPDLEPSGEPCDPAIARRFLADLPPR